MDEAPPDEDPPGKSRFDNWLDARHFDYLAVLFELAQKRLGPLQVDLTFGKCIHVFSPQSRRIDQRELPGPPTAK